MRHARPDLSLLRPDSHGESFQALSRSGGPATGIVDFCVPGNPYFPTPEMFRRLADNLEKILTYYPSDTRSTAEALAGALGLHPQTVAIGNGSTELIAWIDHLLIRENIAVPIPTSGRWW